MHQLKRVMTLREVADALMLDTWVRDGMPELDATQGKVDFRSYGAEEDPLAEVTLHLIRLEKEDEVV